jgi:plasmid stabilization system protein ParE
MVPVRWSKRAQLDFLEIFDILKLVNLRSAVKFADKVRYLIKLIADRPQIGRKVPEFDLPAIREVFWKKYRIIYRIRSNWIELITIFHGSRRLDFT